MGIEIETSRSEPVPGRSRAPSTLYTFRRADGSQPKPLHVKVVHDGRGSRFIVGDSEIRADQQTWKFDEIGGLESFKRWLTVIGKDLARSADSENDDQYQTAKFVNELFHELPEID